MKAMISIAAAAVLLGAAGSAAAQQAVTVGGNAPAICKLPASYTFVGGNGGATGSQFSGQAWNIPGAAIANSSGMPVSGDGYAIRVRGTGFCNTSHTISVQSDRGGLANGDQGADAPDGFANRRATNYRAYWSNGQGAGSAAPVGPEAALTGVVTPGAMSISGPQAPTANAPFDVVLTVLRPASTLPLVAGHYWDTLTVTLTPGS